MTVCGAAMVLVGRIASILGFFPRKIPARNGAQVHHACRGWSGIYALVLAAALGGTPALGDDLKQTDDEFQALGERVRTLERELETLRPSADEPVEETISQDPGQTKSSLSIGGAIRLDYVWQDYNDQGKDKVGDFGFELFRLDVDGSYGDLDLSAQYRWYADFEAIHHAYFGYHLTPEWEAQLGIHQVPFGILPYASHSFWFGATYYLGFEDDYDTGLKILYNEGPWDLQMAFYKNSEYKDSARANRYSFRPCHRRPRDQ